MTQKILQFTLATAFLLSLVACSESVSFEEQIIQDINNYIPSGICEEIPKGTVISNVEVGEITPIEGMGMIDVSYSFDYVIDGKEGHKESAMLYLEDGGRKKLASFGGDCDYKLE